jgi:hypothetical protein
MLPPVLRLGLLHVAPRLGELEQNRELLINATRVAAFVQTPDFDAVTGEIYSSLVAFDRAGEVSPVGTARSA